MNGSRNVFAEAAFRRFSFARVNRTPRCPNPSNSDHALKGFVFMVKPLMKLDLTQSYNKTWILDHLTLINSSNVGSHDSLLRGALWEQKFWTFNFNANNNNNNNGGGGWRREGWLPSSESTKHVHKNLQKKVSVSINRLLQFHHSKLSSSYQEETCPTLTLTPLNWPNLSTPSKRRQFTTPEGFYWASRGGRGRPGAGGGGRRRAEAGAGWRARAGARGGGEHEDTCGPPLTWVNHVKWLTQFEWEGLGWHASSQCTCWFAPGKSWFLPHLGLTAVNWHKTHWICCTGKTTILHRFKQGLVG